MTSKEKVLKDYPTARCRKYFNGLYCVYRSIGKSMKNIMDIECRGYNSSKNAWQNAEVYMYYVEKNGDIGIEMHKELVKAGLIEYEILFKKNK
jgi:hypothetical protein